MKLKTESSNNGENVAILVAIAVNEDGYREALGAAEGMKEARPAQLLPVAQEPRPGRREAHRRRQAAGDAADVFKHGTISLIENSTQVICILIQSELYEKIIRDIVECKCLELI